MTTAGNPGSVGRTSPNLAEIKEIARILRDLAKFATKHSTSPSDSRACDRIGKATVMMEGDRAKLWPMDEHVHGSSFVLPGTGPDSGRCKFETASFGEAQAHSTMHDILQPPPPASRGRLPSLFESVPQENPNRGSPTVRLRNVCVLPTMSAQLHNPRHDKVRHVSLGALQVFGALPTVLATHFGGAERDVG